MRSGSILRITGPVAVLVSFAVLRLLALIVTQCIISGKALLELDNHAGNRVESSVVAGNNIYGNIILSDI